MRVKKRDGTLVSVRLDEITDRISSLSKDLDQAIIDPVKITLEVVEKIHDGISTSSLDSFTAEICHTKAIEHPHFNILASRLIISDHHKNILITANMKFSQVCHILYTNTDQLNEPSPLISDELYQMSQEFENEINDMIVDDRDFLLDYFGFKTLAKSYLIKVGGKVIETPQHMWMRVALGIHGKVKLASGDITELDLNLVKETYDLLSMKYFTHATPTLYNAGTRKNQLFSCFLYHIDDDLKSIYKVLADTAQISKWSGGVGLHISDIRANGSYIRGTGGKGDGIVPMLKVYNDTARYVNQGGRRSGSFAVYIEPWHADIQDFLKCKLPHGDENRRARDLFYALWIPDLFMERVKNNEPWSLMCPSECPGLTDVYGNAFKKLYEKYEKEGRVVKTINAQDLFHDIISSQIETGTPYMAYKDSVNNKSNQKNIGTIKGSNLCVAPETRILTEQGWFPIIDLKDKEVKIWNGEQWSTTTIKQTGTNQKLLKITLSNGTSLQCTEYHKFHIEIGSRPSDKSITKIVEAKDLKSDMKLIKHDLPIIKEGPELKYAYTHGLFCSEGTYHQYSKHKQPGIQLHGKKKELIKYLDIKSSSFQETANNTINVLLPLDISEKFKVPINYSLHSKLRWLEGACDGDGTIARNGTNESIQLSSIHKEYLISVQLMLQTIGIHSKVTKGLTAGKRTLPDGKGSSKEYDCKALYRLLISSVDTQSLLELGFSPKRLKIEKINPQRCARQFVKIVSVEDEGRFDDTYCFTEPLKNMGMFEGILIGNCIEIMEYSDANKYACCVLASIVLPTYVKDGIFDHQKLFEIVKVVTRNLNKVIDINYYPVEETRASNMSERPIGIGVQGLADVFYKLGIAYDSEEAIQVDKEIMETIYFAALTCSMELSKKHGPYATFKGSPISKGQFQFDLWKEFPTTGNKVEPVHSGRYDWEKLRKDIKKHGVRNSLVTALMPTASTSQIMGSAAESFEPITSNCFTRRVKAGEFMLINPYMANDFIKYGLWNEGMRNTLLSTRGSIQNLPDIPQNLKDIYKTVWEIKQRVLIDHSVARGMYIDQSQSLNLYFANGDYDLITKAHFYGWSKGLKTGSYYIRTKPAINSASFTLVKEDETEKSPSKNKESIESTEEEICVVCSS